MEPFNPDTYTEDLFTDVPEGLSLAQAFAREEDLAILAAHSSLADDPDSLPWDWEDLAEEFVLFLPEPEPEVPFLLAPRPYHPSPRPSPWSKGGDAGQFSKALLRAALGLA